MSAELDVIHVLWAVSERYKRPQFVTAFGDALEDAMVEEYEARKAEAVEWFLQFGDESDGPWTFWTEAQQIDRPEVAPDERRNHSPEGT